MDTQGVHCCAQAIQTCQSGLPHAEGGERQSRPRLVRVSEVDRGYDAGSPLRCVLDWIRGFLACCLLYTSDAADE